METTEVITEVNDPTEWFDSLVIVDNKITLRVFFFQIQQVQTRLLKRRHFKLHNRKEVMEEFAEAKHVNGVSIFIQWGKI